jgi:hypothetical protein
MPGEELGVTHEPTLKHEEQGAWHMHLEVDVPHKDVYVAISRRIQGDAAAVAGLRALLAPRCEDALPGARLALGAAVVPAAT